MFLTKLDIRKAFDSVYQETLAALAEQIETDVCINEWEGRAWAS